MSDVEIEYEIQFSQTRDTIWIHSTDGSTVARFGKMGVDLHNKVTEQLAGEPQCRLCTHGKVTLSDWELFREKCLEWWNVTVPADAFDSKYLVES